MVLASNLIQLLPRPRYAASRWLPLLALGGVLGVAWTVGLDARWPPVMAAVDAYLPDGVPGFEAFMWRAPFASVPQGSAPHWPRRRGALMTRMRLVPPACLRGLISLTEQWPWSAAGGLDRHRPPPARRAGGGRWIRRARRARLVVPEGLEECGWGLIDWTGLPRRVHGGLLRAALRIARDGHTVAFTGREYLAGPELTIDGRPCLARHLASRSGTPATKDSLTGLLAAVLTEHVAGAVGLAVVCDQPELTKDDASQTVTAGQAAPGHGGFAAVDVYGYDWTVHR